MKLGEAGSAMMEAAIVLPVMLLVIFGGLDLGLAMLKEIQLTYAAGGGATLEAVAAGRGVAWASAYLPPAIFTVAEPGCIRGEWQLSPFVLPAQWFDIHALVCQPVH
jgi:hypothetical protein